MRCAIYTRKSSDERLDAEYSSLDNQRAYCSAFIASQAGEGWGEIAESYDDGGYSGGSLKRPALSRLRAEIAAGLVDIVVVYKIDRLSRSLRDFVDLVDEFERSGVTFVSVTQSFNTATSMGRLTLNVLLSFAQFERELTGERLRDWFAGARQRGLWMHGRAPLGYDRTDDGRLVVNPAEADVVRRMFALYLRLGSMRQVARRLAAEGCVNNLGRPIRDYIVKRALRNRLYLGEIPHLRGNAPGPHHEPIIDLRTWQRVQRALDVGPKRAPVRPYAPALLKGVIYGPGGYAMGHNFAHGQNGQTYRYYVARPQRRTGKACPVGRLRASEIEQTIVRLVAGLAGVEHIPPHEAAGLVRRIVRRIDISQTDMTITLATGAVITVVVGRLSPTARSRQMSDLWERRRRKSSS